MKKLVFSLLFIGYLFNVQAQETYKYVKVVPKSWPSGFYVGIATLTLDKAMKGEVNYKKYALYEHERNLGVTKTYRKNEPCVINNEGEILDGRPFYLKSNTKLFQGKLGGSVIVKKEGKYIDEYVKVPSGASLVDMVRHWATVKNSEDGMLLAERLEDEMK